MKFFFGSKSLQFYKGLLIKADFGLHDQIADAISKKVPRGSLILDFGAGEGALSERLFDMGYKIAAADKDAASFKSKNCEFHPVNFDQPNEVDAFTLKHANQFDVVLGVEVIEHVQDQWKYVRELMSMAKPGGMVLITTPNTSSWLSRVNFLLTGRFHQFSDSDLSYGHINPISPWEIDLIMKGVGAKSVEISSAGTLPPIYITSSPKLLLINIFALLLRPFSSGMLDGWCVMAIAQKPE
ncbi:methyltransferase domain-containing protein [Pseudomonas chengduensis]|nr:methyltransferase domain-containing protein [Pseudomonas chengduensis]MDH0957202.1 methyltransferase domain-containing protein [Pseudomonas chengduensis]